MTDRSLQAAPPQGSAAIDVLIFLLRAIGVGLATSIILAGATLLLSMDDVPGISQAASMHAASLPRFDGGAP